MRRRMKRASKRCGAWPRAGLPFFEISSATGQGIEELKYAMAAKVLN